MQTFTYGQTPEANIAEALPMKYKMELNMSDMLHLLKALWVAAEQPFPNSNAEWALGFRQSILETIGIEEV